MPIIRPSIGFLGKQRKATIPIIKANSLSNNPVEARAPVGKKIILSIKPVVIAYATAFIHLKKLLSFLILLDKTTPRNRHTKIPRAAVKRSIQGIKYCFVIRFSSILSTLPLSNIGY
jgi:hypothetical protein